MSEYDDWEPEEEPVGDPDAVEKPKGGGAADAPSISEAARSMLESLRTLGITEAEAVARVARDLERERAAAATEPAPASAANANDGGDDLMTKSEARQLADQARAQAVFEAASMTNRMRLEGIIDAAITSAPDFGPETPSNKVQLLHQAAWQRLAGNADVRARGRTMASAEVDRLMSKAIRDCLDDERKFAKKILGQADDKVTVETGNPAGARKRPPPVQSEPSDEYDWEQGYGMRAPTDEERNRQRQRALADFAKGR